MFIKGAAAILVLLLLSSDASAFGTTSRRSHRSMRPHTINIGLGREIHPKPFCRILPAHFANANSEETSGGTQELVKSDAATPIRTSHMNKGQRGEAFLLVQGALMIFIVLGGVPFMNDTLSMILGPILIALGLGTMFLSGKELGGSLSHWSVPVEGGDGLITSGVYSQIRHPMYTGLLTAMAGLAVVTNSAARLALTFALFCVLDRKASHEEKTLAEAYPDYDEYKMTVTGKIIPTSPMAKHTE